MFGIQDPLIWLPYLLMVACVVFSVWYGLKNWHVDDKADKAYSETHHPAGGHKQAQSSTIGEQKQRKEDII